jgi:hypothetical protein
MPGLDAGRAARRQQLEYRVMFALAYPLFLGAEVVGRTFGLMRLAGPVRRPASVFKAARDSVEAVLPYAFMGR